MVTAEHRWGTLTLTVTLTLTDTVTVIFLSAFCWHTQKRLYRINERN